MEVLYPTKQYTPSPCLDRLHHLHHVHLHRIGHRLRPARFSALNGKLTLVGAALALLTTHAFAQQPAVQSPFEGPSFDCRKARSRVDKSICADPELAALDRRLAELFALALSHAPDPGEIKKAQRRWLRERDDCEADACVKNSYEQRMQALETYTGRLPVTLARTLCARLEMPETRAATLERTSGIEDINNDGTPETATACAGGTANVPCVWYLDADERPVSIQPQGFEWLTYSPLGRSTFRYENRTFVYYARDAALAEPSHVSYVTPTNREFRMCEFETNVGSAVDEVMELSYESGGGQGCTFNYFELLTDDRRSLLTGSKSAPVHELQRVPPEGYRGRNCGRIDNRLFKFGNKIYYETNVTNNALVPHELRVLDGTAVATVCTFERQVTTKVTRVFVE
jgi:uncharacterized protein